MEEQKLTSFGLLAQFLLTLRYNQAKQTLKTMNDMEHQAEVNRLSQNNRIWAVKSILDLANYLHPVSFPMLRKLLYNIIPSALLQDKYAKIPLIEYTCPGP